MHETGRRQHRHRLTAAIPCTLEVYTVAWMCTLGMTLRCKLELKLVSAQSIHEAGTPGILILSCRRSRCSGRTA